MNTDDCSYAGGQHAQLSSGDNLTDQGGFGVLAIGGSISTDCTALGYSCYGNAVTATVLGGDPVPGGLQWTVTWYGTKSLKGVIHFLDGGGYEPIPFKHAYQCAATPVAPCWVSTSSSSGNADPLWFQAIIVTTGNGKLGGFN